MTIWPKRDNSFDRQRFSTTWYRCSYIFVPINLREAYHWVVIVIDSAAIQ